MTSIRKHPSLGLLAVLLLLVVATRPALARDDNPGVMPPNSHAFGTTYPELTAAWWQWALAGVAADNPVADPTGVNCAVRQSGPIWFLAGTFLGSATRTCVVPAGKALFFPVVNTVWANDPGDTATEGELRAHVLADMNGSRALAQVDGVDVQNIGLYFTISPAFALTLVDGNVLGAPAGVYDPAVAGGIHLLLAPLSVGQHILHFEGCLSTGFCTEATYLLRASSRK